MRSHQCAQNTRNEATKAAEIGSLFRGDQRQHAQYPAQRVFSEHQETLFAVRMTEHRFPTEVV